MAETALRLLLVDDEPLGIARLQALLAALPDVDVVGTAGDSDAAAAEIAARHPDLVLLDIQMPGRTGIALAASLPAADRPEIIFVTAFEHHAPEAFEVDAADYLLKPVKAERLRIAIERARRRRDLRAAHDRATALAARLAELGAATPDEADGGDYDTELWVPAREGTVRVAVAEIDWIEAARDYVLLHTPLRSHIVRITMAALEKRLNPRDMLRVHRSAFVRPGAVRAVQRQGKGLLALLLDDGAVVQVGPSYTSDLQNALRLGNPAAALDG